MLGIGSRLPLITSTPYLWGAIGTSISGVAYGLYIAVACLGFALHWAPVMPEIIDISAIGWCIVFSSVYLLALDTYEKINKL